MSAIEGVGTEKGQLINLREQSPGGFPETVAPGELGLEGYEGKGKGEERVKARQ